MISPFQHHKIKNRNKFILITIQKHQPVNISKLAEIMGISAGTTIYRYLYPLKKSRLISFNKVKNVRGIPVYIQITKRGIEELTKLN